MTNYREGFMKYMMLFFSLSLYCMKEDVVITIEKDSLQKSQKKEIKCGCLLCKGVKITIATNILSMLAVAGLSTFINYSECSK